MLPDRTNQRIKKGASLPKTLTKKRVCNITAHPDQHKYRGFIKVGDREIPVFRSLSPGIEWYVEGAAVDQVSGEK